MTMPPIRMAPFALRVVERRLGRVAIVYRRMSDAEGRDRLQRIASLGPLPFTVATSLLREAVRCSAEEGLPVAPRHKVSMEFSVGPYYPLSTDWGPRVACFALLSAGLRDAERLNRALGHLRHANPDEAAWWLGLLTREDNVRALRALRILTEAVD